MTGKEAAALLYRSSPFESRPNPVMCPSEMNTLAGVEPIDSSPLWQCSLDLLAEPPEEIAWLLPAILPMGTVVLLSGREGVMKSWLTMDWALAVAEGHPWLNRLGEAGAVLYLDAEMPDNLFRLRLQAIGGSKNFNVWRWQDGGFPVSLDDPRLRKAARRHRLIVVDTLKRFMGGLDENSSTDMARITGALRELTRWGATVLALHHAPKDPEKAGYRGSTELGAGVDLALTLTKQTREGMEFLDLTATKTRFSEDPGLTLRVERTAARPVFHDASGEAVRIAQTALDTDLDQVARVIEDLQQRQSAPPNQSQVIVEAKARQLGSRNTVLTWLKHGEGARWRSDADGRSRVYMPLSYCPPVQTLGGLEKLGNGFPQRRPLQLSTCPESRGPDRLDNRTGTISLEKAQVGTLPVGTVVRFHGGLGRVETGIVEAVTDWPQYPGELCYRVTGGRTIPHSRVLGVEGTP